ncbi:hypothetical protein Tco_1085449 [Tanacetum coccineum]
MWLSKANLYAGFWSEGLMSYVDLVKKFKVGDANQISLSYNIGSISLNIIDDDDVRFFVNEVSGEEIAPKCLKKGYQCKVRNSCPERYAVECVQPDCYCKLILPKVRDITRVYRPKDIGHDVNMEWNIYVSYKKAWKGKHIALASSQGCPIELFAQLPFYCYNLKKENEGTVTDIETDDKGHF